MAERAGAVDGRCLGGRYRIGALLAAGGMGEVWAARDLLLDRAVAVKVLGGALAGDGRAAERLRREARAAGRLDHPNIARVLDLGEHGGRPYLVMELLEGESLAARLDRAGPMAPAEAVRVVAAAADALEAAHRAGVVHRDVKPGNVFLTSDGEVKVLDFGIAWCAHEATLTTGDLLGTAAYLAPERVLGHQATPAADVYSLGVVLYELLAGRRPFEATSDIALAMAHVNAEPPPLARVAPSAPAPLVAAAARAMAKDPSARPPSAAAFALLLHSPDPARGSCGQPIPPLPALGYAPPPGDPAQAHRVPGRPGPTRPLPVGASSATRPVPVAPPGTIRPLPPASATWRLPGARAGLSPRAGRRRRRARPRRRGLLVVLLLAGAVLAALPALGGGLQDWVGERVELPFAVADPGVEVPVAEAPLPSGAGATTDPGRPAAGQVGSAGDVGGAAADDPPDRGDSRDRDDDSGGSGRPGGDDSGGGGSSGPG
jgi:eukaryotic-like serine/threonine-protein kinase